MLQPRTLLREYSGTTGICIYDREGTLRYMVINISYIVRTLFFHPKYIVYLGTDDLQPHYFYQNCVHRPVPSVKQVKPARNQRAEMKEK